MRRSCYLLSLCLILILVANLVLEPFINDNKLVRAAILPPIITNSAGASSIISDSVVLNGEIIDTGGENPVVHIYGGENDGGTDSASWDNDINLGIIGSGTFYADITGLNPNTTYYYRCFAQNSAGSDWADSTSSFTTICNDSTTDNIFSTNITTKSFPLENTQKLVGADDIPPSWVIQNLISYLFLTRYTADYSGIVTQIKVRLKSSGNVKVAIYADSNGLAGELLSANNNSTPVSVGWNTIDIPPIQITKGTVYWLASISDANRGLAQVYSGGPTFYWWYRYSNFTFPAKPQYDQHHNVMDPYSILIAGWGTVIPDEPITHRVAYVPVRFADNPNDPDDAKPIYSIDDLKKRAKMVADYYKQQSYGDVNLSCEFIFDEWTSLPKSFEGYHSPQPIPSDFPDWFDIRDDALDLVWQKGINPNDYKAVVIIQPACVRSIGGQSIVTGEKETYAAWAHEIGHAVFNFNDYYDDNDPKTKSYGNIQNWGLMGDATLMNPTAPIMSYNKVKAEWLTDEPPLGKTEYGEYPIKLLKDLSLMDKIYKYEADTKAAQYFIFEGRQPPDDIAKDNLVPPSGYCDWRYPYELKKDKGILLYKVTPKGWVYSVTPQNLPWFESPDENKVTLTPGDIYKYQDDEAEVKFTALERNEQLYVDINANPLYSRKVISLYDTSWEMPGLPVESEPTPSQWHFDLDLHAYTYDGKEIGMDYTTEEYKVQVADARTSFDTPGGGPEWISLPEDENVYCVIDPTPAREWANELGVTVENIKATWEIVYYDEEGTRKESDTITLDISLDKPVVLGLPVSMDIDPDTLNLKSTGQWITCWIELPGGYDLGNINLNTVMLNYAVPAESDAKYGFVINPEIRDADKDGLTEIMVKFDRAAVQATVQPTDKVTISVLGEVNKDGVSVPFSGTDTIKVISPNK